MGETPYSLANEIRPFERPRWQRVSRGLALGNFVVVLLWAAVGWRIFREVGTLTLMWEANEYIRMTERMQGKSGASDPNSRGNALNVLTFSAPRSSGNMTLWEQKKVQIEYNNKLLLVEGTRQVWGLLTASCIGWWAAAGLGLCMSGSNGAGFMRAMSAVAFGAGCFALGMMVGRHYHGSSQEAWGATIAELTQQRESWLQPALFMVMSFGFLGSVGIARHRHPRTWIGLSIAVGMVGTFVTLIGISLLIRAGLPPLPSWVYAAVALAQSCWSWVLLFVLLSFPRNLALSPVHSI